MNYNGKIDLKKFKNSALIDLKGKTTTKRCICIPVEDNNLFVGEKGVYFDFILREIAEDKRQYGNTHIICPNIPKEKFEKMTEEEKKDATDSRTNKRISSGANASGGGGYARK